MKVHYIFHIFCYAHIIRGLWIDAFLVIYTDETWLREQQHMVPDTVSLTQTGVGGGVRRVQML